MVRTYNEYLKLLEAAVVGNGKRSLSDYQIEQFIKSKENAKAVRSTKYAKFMGN